MSDEHPVLDQINLVTNDIAASVAFYQLLGVPVPEAVGQWSEWNEHHRTAEFGDGAGVSLEIDSEVFSEQWAAEGIPAGPLLSFRVVTREAVDSIHERMVAAGYRSIRAPYDAFWGARYAVIADPGGVAVGVMSETSGAHRVAGPSVADFTERD